MNRSTPALLTSTSPRCERERRLAGVVVPGARVTLAERREMYALLRTYFAGTTRARFEADLREKESVILLREAASGRIQGFSTLMRLAVRVDGREIVAFFSGDTIVDRGFWGETALSRVWGETVFPEADRTSAERPGTAVYWFLICSGYKTWRFLPVFFREFYPSPDAAIPPAVGRLMDTLGTMKFGSQYDPSARVVRFAAAAPLRPGVAEITAGRLRDPRIAFFARMNPGHLRGDELACLAELSRSNLTKAGLRLVPPPAARA
jgi:hypothetical protein